MQPERLVTLLLASPNSVTTRHSSSKLGSALAAPESVNCLRPILSRLDIADASIALPSLLPCLGELSEGLRG